MLTCFLASLCVVELKESLVTLQHLANLWSIFFVLVISFG